MPDRRRLVGIVGWGTAVILALEVGLIDLQAARGTTSHFNVGTPLDAAIFTTMGVAILVAWGLAIALTVALFRQPFRDRALGWALRLGMLVTVVGAGMGGLMTQPTRTQMESARVTHRLPVAGAHTVGAPDGEPGLPGTGWSRGTRRPARAAFCRAACHPDLHQLQDLAAVRRTSVPRRRERAALIVGGSYAALFAILLAQAFAGESVAAPSRITLLFFAAWLAATVAGFASVLSRRRNGSGSRAFDAQVLQ